MVGCRAVREKEIVDPALTIARGIGNSLRRRYGLRPSPIIVAAVDDDPTRISSVDPEADLVLDVWTEPRPTMSSWPTTPRRLKDELNAAGRFCVKHFRSKILSAGQ
ncbi:MAG: hypothetical protein ABW061_14470 [Polyangiaceae bacterium]